MDDRYELEDTKGRPQYSVQEEYGKYVADAYPGQRTDQTRDERTRVRVGEPSLARQRGLADRLVQRVFSFAQIFFFALTYMSSWETMALYVMSDTILLDIIDLFLTVLQKPPGFADQWRTYSAGMGNPYRCLRRIGSVCLPR